ncbi:hypothetical protein Goari_011897 [Gossypium aridum]|uniref:Uncharacterized protein n=1 Tax=Gossypium aridum TaxID=34290 RepID=A0A7J8WYR8_GOSAI|nr:hypothetical protein [Gossypium aridum]
MNSWSIFLSKLNFLRR